MKRILLFDGECNFCDASVQFIIKRDPNALFQFASLQSDVGAALLKKYDVPETTDSIVFIENDRHYTESTAALKITRNLSGFWKLFYVFIVVPKPVRDLVYRWIAKNRYKWFGKKQECMLPSPEQRKRFL
ncbi:thiol-disulfide oxidoreductase DCC family protein [Solibacillus sp. FSL R5-0691]|uniref:thiol-disulfide oxidoreductase DCC family protein n=1 Tax=Solibacillus sp. FSL R5-0691 TaxID=2921653 RepID=UPI0030D2E007